MGLVFATLVKEMILKGQILLGLPGEDDGGVVRESEGDALWLSRGRDVGQAVGARCVSPRLCGDRYVATITILH